MKTLYKNCFLLLAALLFLPTALKAQDSEPLPPGTTPDGVVLNKYVTDNPEDPNRYTINLEAFVTGGTITTETSEKVASDIVLVLDASGSMGDSYNADLYYKLEENSYSGFTFRRSVRYDTEIASSFYYKHTDGKYYQVYTDYYGIVVYNVISAYYMVNGKKWYLKADGTSSTTERTINDMFALFDYSLFRGVLYRRVHTKMEALQASVQSFLDVIYADAQTNGNSHNVSIVKFASDSYYDKSGLHLGEGNHTEYTEVVKNFIPINGTTKQEGGDAPNREILMGSVDELVASGATAADYGMTLAQNLFSQAEYKNNGHKKVVVFFTDGEPNHGSGFSSTVANNTIQYSRSLKNNTDSKYGDKVTVYAVGLMNNASTDVRGYMNGVSSNYPYATTYYQPGLGTGSDQGYFFLDESTKLMEIFEGIAERIVTGGSNYELGPDAEVRDIISQSFKLPEGATVSDIHVYTARFLNVNVVNDIVEYVFEGPVPYSSGIKVKVEGSRDVSVSGFDFSKNYVGYDVQPGGEKLPHGNKLIIRFDIVIDPDAPGGADVDTNDGGSGIYVDGEPIATFKVPSVKIPNVVVIKKGMHKGESAIFTITREKSYRMDESGNIVDPAFTPIKLVATCTEEGKDAIAVLKIQIPGRYRVTEDTWSWAYDISKVQSDYGEYDDKNKTNDAWLLRGFWSDDMGVPATGYWAHRPVSEEDFGTKVNLSERWIERNVNDFTENKTSLYVGTEFIFVNEEKTGTPAHAEGQVNNEFYVRPMK